MRHLVLTVFVSVITASLSSCGRQEARVANAPAGIPSPTAAAAQPITNSSSGAVPLGRPASGSHAISKTDKLCKKLDRIKRLPKAGSADRDSVYEAIIARGKSLMPCLVDEIVNETPMEDPRHGPSWENYKVGDTAVFLLVRIAKDDQLLEEMLPPEYREEWKTNGVYAYFNYVSDTENREHLRDWWRNWVENDSK